MIYITCGTCGTSQGYKRKNDGILKLPVAEERRLVARGVAKYVTKPIIGSDTGVATSGEGEEDGAGMHTAELQEEAAEVPDTLDIVDGHFTPESLMNLSRANMEKLAADMGVNISKCRNKGEIAELLAAVEVRADDSEATLPELGAEEPVV